jgi:uncharacterized protein YvpB
MTRVPVPISDTERTEALNVPNFNQPESENKCMVYALWDVLQFLKNHHSDPWVKDNTNTLDLDEIMEYITVRGAGWPSRQEELDELSDTIGKGEFKLVEWIESSPSQQELHETIQDNLNKDLPLIVIVDFHTLHDTPEQGDELSMHSVVVTGEEDNKYLVNDPWNGKWFAVRKSKLADAWDVRLNQYVEINFPDQRNLSHLTGGEENDNN